MNSKHIRSSRPFFPKEDIDKIVMDIAQALNEGRLRNGKNLTTFETMIAEYLGIKHSIALDSDSSALETALHYYNVKNKEVVVCTNSFISIPNSVSYAGGKVFFADIRKETISMDPNSLRQSISDNTCGVIVTHIAGFPNPDLKEIKDICSEHDLFLIEDATHAIGATVNDRKVGTFGDSAIFAFTPTKVVTTGEGGMLVTDNTELAEFARKYSYYGSGPGKTNFVNLGRHMMMPEISAILGIHQFKRIEEFIIRRNEIADIYNKAFDEMLDVSRIKCPVGSRSSYYKYPLTLSSKVDKTKFVKSLENFKIETGNVFYPPCHQQAVYKVQGEEGLVLPVSEKVLAQTVTMPMHVELSNAEVLHVVESVSLTLNALNKKPQGS
jgi:perosamine synthetase